jgi:hypothetical protein
MTQTSMSHPGIEYLDLLTNKLTIALINIFIAHITEYTNHESRLYPWAEAMPEAEVCRYHHSLTW